MWLSRTYILRPNTEYTLGDFIERLSGRLVRLVSDKVIDIPAGQNRLTLCNICLQNVKNLARGGLCMISDAIPAER